MRTRRLRAAGSQEAIGLALEHRMRSPCLTRTTLSALSGLL